MFIYPTLNQDQCKRFTVYAEYLQKQNKVCNLTRIIEQDQIYVRHFADSLELLSHLDNTLTTGKNNRIIDIGSGAGLPGMALAIARKHWHITSIDATGKKINFQKNAASILKLDNFTGICARAEELSHNTQYRQQFDALVCRAVANLRILIEISAAFLKVGSKMIAMKGPDIDQELNQAKHAMDHLNMTLDAVIPYKVSDLAKKAQLKWDQEDINMNLIIMTKTAPTASCYPRAYGIIKKGKF